jgi:hypothetical protein
MLKITVRNNIVLPKIELQGYLEHIAENIIIPDIRMGIDTGVAIDGSQLPPNDPKTIARKGHARQLIDTGLLVSSFFWKTLSKWRVLVSIDSARNSIGAYLQAGIATKSGIKQYRFFGISQDAFDGAMKYMEEKIGELCRGNVSVSGKG